MTAFKYMFHIMTDFELEGRAYRVGERIELENDDLIDRLLDGGYVIATSETAAKIREQRNADSVANARAQLRKMGL